MYIYSTCKTSIFIKNNDIFRLNKVSKESGALAEDTGTYKRSAKKENNERAGKLKQREEERKKNWIRNKT